MFDQHERLAVPVWNLRLPVLSECMSASSCQRPHTCGSLTIPPSRTLRAYRTFKQGHQCTSALHCIGCLDKPKAQYSYQPGTQPLLGLRSSLALQEHSSAHPKAPELSCTYQYNSQQQQQQNAFPCSHDKSTNQLKQPLTCHACCCMC